MCASICQYSAALVLIRITAEREAEYTQFTLTFKSITLTCNVWNVSSNLEEPQARKTSSSTKLQKSEFEGFPVYP